VAQIKRSRPRLVQQKQYEALGKFEIAQCIRGVADDLEEEFLEGRP
jgi:hypothetical protein